IEKDALERYRLQELVTNPDVLARARPSQTLLKAVLHTKHLMNQEVLAVARALVRRVIEQLMERLARPVRSAFLGAADRRRRTHLVLFDTNVVDVTEHCPDPVEAILKVQLGGGTDIGGALSYAAGLVDNPRRTVVVLITDFFEGGPLDRLFAAARQLLESGVT